MKHEAVFYTAEEILKRGKADIPDELLSGKNLVYSSPATLAYNSPGAEGFGVKRAGLSVPESVMLIVAPGCCGRNTSLISSMPANLPVHIIAEEVGFDDPYHFSTAFRRTVGQPPTKYRKQAKGSSDAE